MVRQITLGDVEFLAHQLAQELLTFNEPIPDFKTRFPNRLESCLVTPFLMFGGKQLYPTLVAKASILFYLMTKNHPFQNGNKRIAMTTLLIFLTLNGKWLAVKQSKFYEFTMQVAQSSPELKDEIIAAIQKFVEGHLTNFS